MNTTLHVNFCMSSEQEIGFYSPESLSDRNYSALVDSTTSSDEMKGKSMAHFDKKYVQTLLFVSYAEAFAACFPSITICVVGWALQFDLCELQNMRNAKYTCHAVGRYLYYVMLGIQSPSEAAENRPVLL